MQTIIKRNLLRYAAGRSIFCPYCDICLDCKRTVVVEVTTAKGNQVTKTMCSKCWAAKNEEFRAVVAEHGGTMDVMEWAKG
tara:strand:- start:59 stop:301 length:243 start_codon:yes stop_codon:yes gene_type:complete